MARNQSLHAANRAKYDEFYTQLSDIENELKHYRKHFRGKVIYCNCDDPIISNFFIYFRYNFEKLGLKRLITTCYKNPNPDLFSEHNEKNAVGIEYHGTGPCVFPLEEGGDFRSKECIELLEQADIVVTNPPFSLFREYIAQLIKYDKKFLVIGNQNAISYKEIFPLIKSGKVWLGRADKAMLFDVTEDYAQILRDTREEGSAYIQVGDTVKVKLGYARWFTNLDHKKRHEDLILYKKYSPEEYPKYDNYDAIEVNKVVDIPEDFAGLMGVPISFLDKHNPDQFEIIGMDRPLMTELTGRQSRFKINSKEKYARIIIRNRRIQQ